MATTITRESMTDAVTVWNVARIGSAIYDRIDSLIANNITFGGTVGSEAAGTHSFSASSTGSNVFLVRNTNSGTAAQAALQVGNDTSASAITLQALSSTYTGNNNLAQLAVSLAGGLRILCSNTNAPIGFYTNSTRRMYIDQYGVTTVDLGMVHTPGTPTLVIAGTLAHFGNGVQFFTASGALDMYGLTAGANGQVIRLVNVGANTATLKHESASATAADRFRLPGDADLVLAEDEGATFVYSTSKSRWIALLG